MFEWLDEEVRRIKTRKFHRIDGPASAELRQAVEECDFPLPPSYREFVLRFGNAELYRFSSYWLVEVYAGPRIVDVDSDDEMPLIQFGRTHASLSYFKESLLSSGGEAPVFEWRHARGIRRFADSFEEWLKIKCDFARRQFKKREWKAIEQGPPPFNAQELAIVNARNRFRWRVIGIAADENLCFEIHNGSEITLPYLSVGIRGRLRPPKSGPLNGGAFLPIGSILPGETKIVEFDCYKKFIAPDETEAFALPDPGPEDRDRYWEFRAIS